VIDISMHIIWPEDTLFELWGIRNNCCENTEERELLAIFTESHKAWQYVETAKLRHPQVRKDGTVRVFRGVSLLCEYDEAEVLGVKGSPIDPHCASRKHARKMYRDR
jgi:hypothetical protein